MKTMTTIKKGISELDMVDAFFRSGHFKQSRMFVEIPVFSRCVDMVVLNNRNEVSAIEFKKEKWKEAIDQVLRVSTSFDFLEICILAPAHDELKKEIVTCCREQGIGVYFMNPTTMKVKKVLQSRKNPSIWKVQKKDVINYLEAERNG